MKIKCIVIDDEFLARKLLDDYISKLPYLDLIAKCSGAGSDGFESSEHESNIRHKIKSTIQILNILSLPDKMYMVIHCVRWDRHSCLSIPQSGKHCIT